jgi:hypothetical protein
MFKVMRMLAGCLAMTYAASSFAQSQPPMQGKPTESTLIFAVSEGTSGAQDNTEVFLKYEELVALMGRTLD